MTYLSLQPAVVVVDESGARNLPSILTSHAFQSPNLKRWLIRIFQVNVYWKDRNIQYNVTQQI